MKQVMIFDQEVSAKDTKRGKRVWFRSSMLKKIGKMNIGDKLKVIYYKNQSKIKLVATSKDIECDGELSITSSRGEASFDLHNKTVALTLKDVTRVFIEVSMNEIVICLRRTDDAIQRRIENFKSRVRKNQPLLMGDVCSGIGGMAYAISSGLTKEGSGAKLAFAIDYHKETTEAAALNNPLYDEDTNIFNMSLEQTPIERLNQVDILTVGLSCKGASKAARTGKKISAPELHPEAGWLPLALIPILSPQGANPLVVCFENVTEWLDTVSAFMIKELMTRLGYDHQEQILESKSFGAIEARKRACLIFTTVGMDLDLTLPEPQQNEVPLENFLVSDDNLPPVPSDINCELKDRNGWYPKERLLEREQEAIEKGRGHRAKIMNKTDVNTNTFLASYGKGVRLDEGVVESKCGKWVRLLTPVELAHVKDLPVELVNGVPKTLAAQFLGNSVEKKCWEWVGAQIFKSLFGFRKEVIINKPLSQLAFLFEQA